MGQVWQATDTQLNRQVALKILHDAFAADPDRLARFQREAQVLASLNHPGIAAIYGIERSEDRQALVLELVEGPTLADRIAKEPIPLDEALPIAKQIAEALEAAHEAGVIHRDLGRKAIKGLRWLLSTHSRHRTMGHTRFLNSLRNSNRRIHRAWVLKDEFEHFWDYRYRASAKKFLTRWMTAALRSRLPTLRTFVGTLRSHLPHILAFIVGAHVKVKQSGRVSSVGAVSEFFGFSDQQEDDGLWALVRNRPLGGFASRCGRVVCVHTCGSVHSPCRGVDSVFRIAYEWTQT